MGYCLYFVSKTPAVHKQVLSFLRQNFRPWWNVQGASGEQRSGVWYPWEDPPPDYGTGPLRVNFEYRSWAARDVIWYIESVVKLFARLAGRRIYRDGKLVPYYNYDGCDVIPIESENYEPEIMWYDREHLNVTAEERETLKAMDCYKAEENALEEQNRLIEAELKRLEDLWKNGDAGGIRTHELR